MKTSRLALLQAELERSERAYRAAVAALSEAEREQLTRNDGTVAVPMVHTFPSAAQRLGISRTAMFGLVRRGELPAIDLPGVGRRIREVDLVAFIERLDPTAAQPPGSRERSPAV